MTTRDRTLQLFVESSMEAFSQFAQTLESARTVRQIASALETQGDERSGPGKRLPVCAYLDTALAVETEHTALRQLVARFRDIEPFLEWRRRSNQGGSASRNFEDGHANAMIIGPGGVEERKDIWLGVTLMAPNVRYPNHNHAPEEVYLVLSEGEFCQDGGEWFSPGIGGSFYNIPSIRHAMRSIDTPLFAFWALWAEQLPE